MPRIIVLDDISPEGLKLLDAAPGIEYEIRTKLKGAELREALTQYDGAVCRSGVKITAEALQGNTRLRCIARAGVGVDNIDLTAATRAGIVVMNTPDGNTLSTAEHAFALMLALSRNIAPAYASLLQGKWERSKYLGTQLANKTLGVVGLGRIGLEVAKRALAFGMKVLAYDPFLSPEKALKLGVEQVATVREMLPRLDFLTVHTPLTNETKNLISTAEVALLKKGARLINCARGGIYDEAALLAGLQSGQLAGVALDVFVEEPCTSSPLFGQPGVLCTPHLGASTEEAQTLVAVEAVQLVVNYLTTGEIQNAVNVSSVDPKTLADIRGFLDVAYRLGLFLYQWHGGGVKRCKLEYRGEVTGKNTRLLTAAFCAGLLAKALEGEANIVNAEVLLRERGIELLAQSRSEQGSFSSSITAEVETSEATHVASGTLFGADMPRLIRLDEHRLEAYLDGTLLIFTHNDVPGIIGAVGTIFGQHKVNIAQMAVGRAGLIPGGPAIGVLNLDTRPPQAALDACANHPDIQSVRVVEMPKMGQLPPWLQG